MKHTMKHGGVREASGVSVKTPHYVAREMPPCWPPVRRDRDADGECRRRGLSKPPPRRRRRRRRRLPPPPLSPFYRRLTHLRSRLSIDVQLNTSIYRASCLWCRAVHALGQSFLQLPHRRLVAGHLGPSGRRAAVAPAHPDAHRASQSVRLLALRRSRAVSHGESLEYQ